MSDSNYYGHNLWELWDGSRSGNNLDIRLFAMKDSYNTEAKSIMNLKIPTHADNILL